MTSSVVVVVVLALAVTLASAQNFRFSTDLTPGSTVQVFSKILMPTGTSYIGEYYDYCGFDCTRSNPSATQFTARSGGGFNYVASSERWRQPPQVSNPGPYCARSSCDGVSDGTNADLFQTRKTSSGGYQPEKSKYQVRWGQPGSGNQASGFGFNPEIDQPLPLNQEFKLGQLKHYNFPIWYASKGFTIRFPFRVWESGKPNQILASQVFEYDFTVDETPNNFLQTSCCPNNDNDCLDTNPLSWSAGQIIKCPYESVLDRPGPSDPGCDLYPDNFPKCPDQITATNAFQPNIEFVLAGITYTLILTGFKQGGSTRSTPSFLSEEEGVTPADLWGIIRLACPDCAGNKLPIYNETTLDCQCECPDVGIPTCNCGNTAQGETCWKRDARSCECYCAEDSCAGLPGNPKPVPCDPNAVRGDASKCCCDCTSINCGSDRRAVAGSSNKVNLDGTCGDCECKDGADICNGKGVPIESTPECDCECGPGTCPDGITPMTNCECPECPLEGKTPPPCHILVNNATMCKFIPDPDNTAPEQDQTCSQWTAPASACANPQCDFDALKTFCATLNREPEFEAWDPVAKTGKCGCKVCDESLQVTAGDKCTECQDCPVSDAQHDALCASKGKYYVRDTSVAGECCACDAAKLALDCQFPNFPNMTTCACEPKTGSCPPTDPNYPKCNPCPADDPNFPDCLPCQAACMRTVPSCPAPCTRVLDCVNDICECSCTEAPTPATSSSTSSGTTGTTAPTPPTPSSSTTGSPTPSSSTTGSPTPSSSTTGSPTPSSSTTGSPTPSSSTTGTTGVPTPSSSTTTGIASTGTTGTVPTPVPTPSSSSSSTTGGTTSTTPTPAPTPCIFDANDPYKCCLPPSKAVFDPQTGEVFKCCVCGDPGCGVQVTSEDCATRIDPLFNPDGRSTTFLVPKPSPNADCECECDFENWACEFPLVRDARICGCVPCDQRPDLFPPGTPDCPLTSSPTPTPVPSPTPFIASSSSSSSTTGTTPVPSPTMVVPTPVCVDVCEQKGMVLTGPLQPGETCTPPNCNCPCECPPGAVLNSATGSCESHSCADLTPAEHDAERAKCSNNGANQKVYKESDCSCNCPDHGAVCPNGKFKGDDCDCSDKPPCLPTHPDYPNCICVDGQLETFPCPISEADCVAVGKILTFKCGPPTQCSCECPPEQVQDPVTGACLCAPNPSTCKQIYGADTQFVYDATTCKCVCPPGGPQCPGNDPCVSAATGADECACKPGAEIGIGSCVVCGDGIVSPGEECDDSNDPCCNPGTCTNKTVGVEQCTIDDCKQPGVCVASGVAGKLECVQTEDRCQETECRKGAGTICEKNTDGSFKQCNFENVDNVGCGDAGLCSGICKGGLCEGRITVCDAADAPAEVQGKPCWAYNCDPATGACAVDWQSFLNSSCSDGDLCTDNDRCVPNPDAAGAQTLELVCKGESKCTEAAACRVSTCDSATGRCNEEIDITEPECTAGSKCRGSKKCTKLGTCTGPKRQCPDDVCVAARCMETGDKAGECVNSTLYKDLQGCDDEDNCTDGDYCKNGTCTPGDDTCNNGSAALWPLGVAAGVVGLAALIAAVAVFFAMQGANLADPVTWGDFTGSQIENNPIYDSNVAQGDNPLYGN